MKISKLFHILYASLMLAPIFAIGGSMAFNIINDKSVDNAQVEDVSQVQYLYETNDVEQDSDFVVGNIYLMDIDLFSLYAHLGLGIEYIFYENIASNNILFMPFSSGLGSLFAEINLTAFPMRSNLLVIDDVYSEVGKIGFSFYVTDIDENEYTFSFFYRSDVPTTSYILSFPIIINSIYPYISYNVIEYVSFKACPQEYIPYEIVNVERPQDLSDNFYFALEDMANSPYFSWASSGFLVQPFAYIFGLFGVPLNSPIMILLSYWLTISIIWLVFDLTMYVPLLVHSWIDKGVVE